MIPQQDLPDDGTGSEKLPPPASLQPTIELSRREDQVHFSRPSLREMVATRVLNLFTWSLLGTLAFAGVLVLIDAIFILLKVITPDQRLMTERIIMTFVTATVVQVGAAIAAIVFSVFKTSSGQDQG